MRGKKPTITGNNNDNDDDSKNSNSATISLYDLYAFVWVLSECSGFSIYSEMPPVCGVKSILPIKYSHLWQCSVFYCMCIYTLCVYLYSVPMAEISTWIPFKSKQSRYTATGLFNVQCSVLTHGLSDYMDTFLFHLPLYCMRKHLSEWASLSACVGFLHVNRH